MFIACNLYVYREHVLYYMYFLFLHRCNTYIVSWNNLQQHFHLRVIPLTVASIEFITCLWNAICRFSNAVICHSILSPYNSHPNISKNILLIFFIDIGLFHEGYLINHKTNALYVARSVKFINNDNGQRIHLRYEYSLIILSNASNLSLFVTL